MLRRALALADVVALLAALALAGLVVASRHGADLLPGALPLLPLWIAVFKLYGLYDRGLKRIRHTSIDELPSAFHASVLCTLVLWAFCRLALAHELAFAQASSFGIVVLAGSSLMRGVARRVVARRFGPERVVLVGYDAASDALVRKIGASPEPALDLVGVVADFDVDPDEMGFPPFLGGFSSADVVLEQTQPDRVIVARSNLGEADALELLNTCRILGTKISVLPGPMEALGPTVEVDEVGGSILLGLTPPALGRSSRWMKRLLDLVVAVPALVLLSPLLAVIAVAVRIDSGAPVLYRQRRIGKRGKPFQLVKFRTMDTGADDRRAELMALSADVNWLDLESDPRITSIGRVLRRTSLDELPQLFNVVRGQMSLVGPRPLPELEDERVRGWGRGRLDLTPGMTGLWQVRGRNRISFDEMVKLDYLYVANWSLWMDLQLLLHTVPAVFARRGAR